MILVTTRNHAESSSSALFQSVIQATVRAWDLAGHLCRVQVHDPERKGVLGSVHVPEARRLEVVVDSSPGDSVWDALAKLHPGESWQLCALVPQSALGRAHERLRDYGFELQGWWVQDNGEIVFGGVERA